MMNLRKLIVPILLLLFTLAANNVKAQDPHLSLWQYAPLYANPALGSVYNGQFRASVNYRNQWYAFLGNDAFKTLHTSFDVKLPVFGQDYFSVGINILSDKAGQASYGQTNTNITASYMKILSNNRRYNRTQYLIAGGQFGFGQRGISADGLQFSQQFNGQDFDPTLSSGEFIDDNSKTYMDLNAGLVWYGVFDDRLSVWAGLSAYHLNRPSIEFYDNTAESLYRRMSVQAGGEIPINEELSILPSMLLMSQGPSVEIAVGASLRYAQPRLWNDTALRAGVMQRSVGRYNGNIASDALAISAGIEYQRFMMMINYDLNSSSLTRATNNRGAFELSLTYTHPPRSRRERVQCPRF